MFLKAMHGIARHGREMLVAGLLAGLVLPGVAAAVRPYIPELVASLLFLTALRIGPKAAFGGARAAQTSLGLVLTYQLLAPLVVLGLIGAIGVAATPLGLVVVLMLAAPSVTAKVISSPCPRIRVPSATSPPKRNTSLGGGGASATCVGARKKLMPSCRATPIN